MEPRHVAGRNEQQCYRQSLGWPLHFRRHIIDKGGVGAASAVCDCGEDRIIHHGPQQGTGRAAHANAAQQLARLAKATCAWRRHRAPSGQGDHWLKQPLRDAPSLQDLTQPGVPHPLEGF
eukprot:12082401-Alexandrium_andersonii.AAC.1